jgi:hypothetical protein
MKRRLKKAGSAGHQACEDGVFIALVAKGQKEGAPLAPLAGLIR